MKNFTNPEQLKAIRTLLNKQKLNDDADKNSIVSSFSGGRTTSIRELYFEEAKALVGHLKSLDPGDVKGDRMINNILSMAHEMNWRIPGTEKIDIAHINNWCKAFSYLKKPLDDYTYNELPKLVTQFKEVYKSHLNKV